MPRIRYNEDLGRWQDVVTGDIAKTPRDASNKKYFPEEDAWRWEPGHPNAGQYAPDPRPEIVPWSRRNENDQFYNPATGEFLDEKTAAQRNRNLERAQIFKGIAKRSDLTYQDLQQMFKGIRTTDLRGGWKGLSEAGRAQYGEPSEAAKEVYRQIEQEHGLVVQPAAFIRTP